MNKLARAASHRSIVGDTRVHYRSRSDAWTSGSLPSTEVEKEIGKADGRASHKKKFPSRSMNFHAFFDRAGHPSCNISWARNSFLLLLLTRHDYTVVSLSLIFTFRYRSAYSALIHSELIFFIYSLVVNWYIHLFVYINFFFNFFHIFRHFWKRTL